MTGKEVTPMKQNAADKIKDMFEDLIRDRKSLLKIMSVTVILLLALILRIHGANKANITVDTADAVTEEGSDGPEESGVRAPSDKIIYIDLGGAVAKPGVYKVSPDTRLYMVIEMAGGLTEDADTNSVNQASFVEDGEKIIIPSKGDISAAPEDMQGADAVSPDASGLVNINTAAKDELMTLNGIGEVMAERIIEYRKNNRFRNKEDIMSVKGIGSGIYEKIKDSIIC